MCWSVVYGEVVWLPTASEVIMSSSTKSWWNIVGGGWCEGSLNRADLAGAGPENLNNIIYLFSRFVFSVLVFGSGEQGNRKTNNQNKTLLEVVDAKVHSIEQIWLEQAQKIQTIFLFWLLVFLSSWLVHRIQQPISKIMNPDSYRTS